MATPRIVPITSPRHIPAVAHVKRLAFEHSAMNQVMYSRDQSLTEKWFAERENVALQDPRQEIWAMVREVGPGEEVDEASCIIVPPESEGDGEGKRHVMLAWAKWQGLKPNKPPAGASAMETDVNACVNGDATAKAKAEAQHLWTNPDALPRGAHVELVQAFREKMKAKKAEFIDEKKDCVLDLLCTNPAYGRQGHGRALLQHGIELADENGVRVYLEATNVGLSLYERLGWKTMGRLELVLSEFGVQHEGDKEGKLLLTCMIRKPRGKGEGRERGKTERE